MTLRASKDPFSNTINDVHLTEEDKLKRYKFKEHYNLDQNIEAILQLIYQLKFIK